MRPRPGALVGGDPLNNALMAVWGWTRGAFGVRPMLGGVTAPNAPAAAVEGGAWTFAYLGANYCVEVRDGVTVRCETGEPVPRSGA